MTGKTPHIVGLGNALVDVVAAVEPEVIGRHGLTTGGMHLVDATAAHDLFEEVGPGVRQSGGSVANSVAHARAAGNVDEASALVRICRQYLDGGEQ